MACTCNPRIQEDEAEESLEPRRQKLQWAEIAPLLSSLGNKSKIPSQKKKEKKKKTCALKFSNLNCIVKISF